MTDQCRLQFIAVDVVPVAGLFLKYQRYVNDKLLLLYKLAKSGQLIEILTSVLHVGCDSLQ